MDRLSPVALAGVLAALAGCKESSRSEPSSSAGARYNAPTVVEKDRVTAAELCDAMPEPAKAPRFEMPPLAEGASLPAAEGWRWINIWATWCKPCIEELPRLGAWHARLAERKLNVDLVFVSADESDEAIAAFRAEHDETPEGPRLAEPGAVAPWLESIGVPGASLPIHIFVDGDDRIRCVRASAVGERDFDGVVDLLSGG